MITENFVDFPPISFASLFDLICLLFCFKSLHFDVDIEHPFKTSKSRLCNHFFSTNLCLVHTKKIFRHLCLHAQVPKKIVVLN